MNSHAYAREIVDFENASQHLIDVEITAKALIPLAPYNANVYVRKGDGTPSIAAADLGKVPGMPTSDGKWCGFARKADEPSILENGATPDEQRRFMLWKTPNVGILGRFYPGLDSDANTPAAARIVEAALAAKFGADMFIPKRTRGDSPRALFVFEAETPGAVASRTLEYRLRGEPEGVTHKLEMIGQGKQWVACGIHPTGRPYGWDWVNDISEVRDQDGQRLIKVSQADIDDLFRTFDDELKAAGGEVISRGKAKGAGNGDKRDYSFDDPIMPVGAIFTGLKRLPNSPGNFPHYDDFISILAAIRAALGNEADKNYDRVREWATAHADDHAVPVTETWVASKWRSLDEGVRVDQHALDKCFRQRGIHASAASAFPDDAAKLNKQITGRIGDKKERKAVLLYSVSQRWFFKTVNMRTDDTNARVRAKSKVLTEEVLSQWFTLKTTDHEATKILPDVHAEWGKTLDAMWQFMRELEKAYPEVFYTAETQHPLYDVGDMVSVIDAQGNETNLLNVRPSPEAQKLAKALSKGDGNNHPDTLIILDFMSRIFGLDPVTKLEGVLLKYEIDTVAWMLQTNKRPGNMLMLQGDPGCGKSVYCNMHCLILDGKDKHTISGTNLANESAARFAWSPLVGARSLYLTELQGQRDLSKVCLGSLDSKLKQLIDATNEGDSISIEFKHQDTKMVENHARIIASSNHQETLSIDDQDRRVFYMPIGITQENRPPLDWWENLRLITENPKRLKWFVRFLLDRDVSAYNENAAPPVTDGKLQQQRLLISDLPERHVVDALRTLKNAGRVIVELDEILTLMTAARFNEYGKSQDEDLPAPEHYVAAFGREGNVNKRVFKRITQKFELLDRDKMRTRDKRWTVYVRKDYKSASVMAHADRGTVLDALENDRADHPILEQHMPAHVRGPVTPPAKGIEDFD